MKGGFFQGFADAGLDSAFAGVEVAGRVVQAQAVLRVFLDQQELAIAFDDGGNGDTGFPT